MRKVGGLRLTENVHKKKHANKVSYENNEILLNLKYCTSFVCT